MLARDVGPAKVLQLLILPLVGRTLHTRAFGISTVVLVDKLMAALIPDFTLLSAHVELGTELLVLYQFCQSSDTTGAAGVLTLKASWISVCLFRILDSDVSAIEVFVFFYTVLAHGYNELGAVAIVQHNSHVTHSSILL